VNPAWSPPVSFTLRHMNVHQGIACFVHVWYHASDSGVFAMTSLRGNCSDIPAFRHSGIPAFRHSGIPVFRHG
jgi:hypothetical protein